jgi:AP endonuclease-2
MNPEGMFVNGERLEEWSTKSLLPTLAKLIPEFDRRRSIRDMFFKPAVPSRNKEASLSDIREKTSETSPTPTSGGPLSENKEIDVNVASSESNLQRVSTQDSLLSEASIEAQSFLPRTPPVPAPAPCSQPSSSYASNSLAKRQAPSLVFKRLEKKNKAALKKESSEVGTEQRPE